MNRRGFLAGILAAGMAPAVVRAASLMKVISPTGLVAPPSDILLVPSIISREALRILEAQFRKSLDQHEIWSGRRLTTEMMKQTAQPGAPWEPYQYRIASGLTMRKPKLFTTKA